MELYIPSWYNIYHDIHICTFSQQANKRIRCLQSTTRGYRGLHLHTQSNTNIHLLPKKSRIHYKVKSPSNVQLDNHVPLVLSMNSYRLIVLRCTPKVHMIPSQNANDQKNPSPVFPSLLYSPLGNLVKCFHVVTHFPSSASTPISSSPSLGKYSSHRKIQKLRNITTLKPSYWS